GGAVQISRGRRDEPRELGTDLRRHRSHKAFKTGLLDGRDVSGAADLAEVEIVRPEQDGRDALFEVGSVGSLQDRRLSYTFVADQQPWAPHRGAHNVGQLRWSDEHLL